MDSFGEYFLFYGLTEFIYAYRSRLKVLSSSSCPRLFPLSLPGVFARFAPICSRRPLLQNSSSPGVWHEIRSPRPLFQNWFSYSLFPLTEEGGNFRFWDSSQSFGFYLLPSPVRRFVRATICPCTPFFTHPVTEYKHLLVSILTWICYLRNWPRFLFKRSVLGLLIQIRRNSSNPLFLFSQWNTTWHNIVACEFSSVRLQEFYGL